MSCRLLLLCVWMVLGHGLSSAAPLTPETEATVFNAVIAHLENDYVEPEIGESAAAALKRAKADGQLTGQADGQAYADRLSSLLQAVSGDGHLNVEFTETSARGPETDFETTDFETDEIERYYGAHINFGVQSVSRLDGNVGLLDLRVFAPIDMGAPTVSAAMNTLAHTDALIIDLRNNGGGMGDMADLVASYLFGPVRQPLTGVYDRPTDTLTQRFTQAFVPGDRFGPDKPVYVLISSKTFSAAEALAYNLQALDRAIIVGEVSGGGAHPFEYVPIHEHFVLWSVTAKSVNPITKSNWQSVGVQPDISVNADDALEAALDHLENTQLKSQD